MGTDSRLMGRMAGVARSRLFRGVLLLLGAALVALEAGGLGAALRRASSAVGRCSSAWILQRLKLTCHEPLRNIAFNLNLRHFTMGAAPASAPHQAAAHPPPHPAAPPAAPPAVPAAANVSHPLSVAVDGRGIVGNGPLESELSRLATHSHLSTHTMTPLRTLALQGHAELWILYTMMT